MKRFLTVAGVAAALAAPLSASAGETVKLLAGFEWDEYAGKLPRWHYLGKPYLQSPPPRWTGEKIEKLDDVGPDGFMIFDGAPSHSRHHTGPLMLRQHATQGQFAWKCRWDPKRWSWVQRQLKSKRPGAWPTGETGYDIYDHFFQRECQLWKQAWRKPADWSGFERLRFDVTSVGARVRLGFRVRDASGPLLRGKLTGLRTGLAVFAVPADKTVTCDVPLAELATAGELDLGRVHRYNIRFNGLPAGTPPKELYLDNVRLVAKDGEPKPKLPVVRMAGAVRPFARRVYVKPPTERIAEKLKREIGPVEPLGPVVINRACLFSSGAGHMGGHFGGSGATYFQTARRAVVAYDNRRLLVVMAGATAPIRSRKVKRVGGLLALASSDGGKTWTGLQGETVGFSLLRWHLRAGYHADRFGNVYGVGTPNCDSYNEGQDICLHRLAFTGKTWVNDRFAIIHQDGYKCPSNCQALALANRRIWAAWGDGFGGSLARYSDDDGFTWVPCKDAAQKPPRPFYEPKLEDLGKPDAPKPPKEILLWPTPVAIGPFITPYKDGVAALGSDRRGPKWAVHDGAKWLPPKPRPAIGRGLITVTTVGADRVCVARGGGYHNLGHETLAKYVVVALLDGGTWKRAVLDTGAIGSTIVTASGDAAYCFYVKKVGEPEKPAYEVHYRRWKAGKWEAAVKVATEDRRINHLTAPQVCPPSYAAVFWDQHFTKRTDPSEVKFVRVPNRQE